MTEQEYIAGRAKAVPVLVRVGYSRSAAEDAVQAAALYFLGRAYPFVTPSLFTQVARLRARDAREALYGSDRPHGRARALVFAGTPQQVAALVDDSPVCGLEEENE